MKKILSVTLLFFASPALLACCWASDCLPAFRDDSRVPHAGREAMIKVTVMYPNSPGIRFDHNYYRDRHMPLIKSRMGAGLKYYSVERGLAGGALGTPATYVAACDLLCDSVETYQSSFGPHAQEIRADICNFTDQTPVVQISEVVVENSAERWPLAAAKHE
jgi:uncharacterized protein (TIGR02118 family)